MDKSKDKIITILIIIGTVVFLLLLNCIFPYKEVLECKGNECSVERLYAQKSRNCVYHFNKSDNLDIYVNRVRNTSSIIIVNNSDNDVFVIENSFITRRTAKKIIELIKSDCNYIKITKYWIGYKIEK